MSQHAHIKPHALKFPGINKMKKKKIVLASNSPRRLEILKTFGLEPQVVPSIFAEDLPKGGYENKYEYPVATATEKAVEVYRRLVEEDPDDAPDLVIAADTVVFTHDDPNVVGYESTPLHASILEKPETREENLRMLQELNGKACEVVTGVTVVWPIISAPGYMIKSMDERTIVHFADNSKQRLKAYVESGEGLDRAGGFAIQGLGGLLIAKIDGDFWNVVGFPASSFFQMLDILAEEEEDFLAL
ncbi:SubName: Full=Related to septum formation maf {ECO:0000313/EMBL:CCA73844.1} [Serendipita indica DSM 11827]|uniref:Related to septum formation maf n=1 Tax=Serendipita indica (strain DSM 11827) TaxID=1109443 RepID=G4TRA1_SERID|nr:SubName: Full=Related to septum formation maf {ECO:0000313/EMBL:CCA73844.1} [Serendipita indica DSM 11827]CCA73844.1 related to septum formation maf [Serendipita indica DSM 11827]